jgi:6-pyruvoyl-tetrahydropterin synthase
MGAVIAVKHNIEVAHRLYETPGKCENIHGHSMWVTLFLDGAIDKRGMLDGLDFGDVKKVFRKHLDETYDHHLLLNASDPFAGPIYPVKNIETRTMGGWNPHEQEREVIVVAGMDDAQPQSFLPGLNATAGDPTTENIASWIAIAMSQELERTPLAVEVWETSVNMARWERS